MLLLLLLCCSAATNFFVRDYHPATTPAYCCKSLQTLIGTCTGHNSSSMGHILLAKWVKATLCAELVLNKLCWQ